MTQEELARAQRLWLQGVNTYSISKIFKIDEADVYNRIEQIKKSEPLPTRHKI